MLKHTGERVWMLQTIHEFATEHLVTEDGYARLRSRHAEHYVSVVEDAERWFEDEQRQTESFGVVETDYANVRAALAWSLERDDREIGLRLAGALRHFWYGRGYLSEGRRWLASILSPPEEPSIPYARALFCAALLATMQADWPEAERLSGRAFELGRELGEHRIAAESLLTWGRAILAAGDREHACAVFEQAASLARDVGAGFVVAMASFNLGYAALSAGDYVTAQRHFEAARGHHEAQGNRYGIARSLAALGSLAVHEGRREDAVALLKTSLASSGTLGDKECVAWGLELLGVALAR